MIIDAHIHIWNKLHGTIGRNTPLTAVANGVIKIGDDQMLGMPATMHDCAARAEYFVAEMDAAGVDIGVVVQENMDGEQNDYCLEVLKKHHGRFFAHALPSYWDLNGIEVEARSLFERGFRGLKLPAGHLVDQVELDDAHLLPIYRHMEEKGYVLAVDLCEGDVQVPAMERVLDKFPALRMAIGHFGMPNRGGWPGQLNLCKHKNVYLETGGIIWLYRDEGYPFPAAIDAIQQAAAEVGIERLMWGSDWPRTMVDFTYRQSIQFLAQSERFSEEEKTWLLGKSAATLYQLPWSEDRRRPAKLITEG